MVTCLKGTLTLEEISNITDTIELSEYLLNKAKIEITNKKKMFHLNYLMNS